MTTAQVTAKVLLFGPFADAVGASSVEVRLPDDPGVTAARVMALLAEQQSALRPLLAHAMLAVNCERVAAETVVRPGDELAIIGLVSGG